MWIVLLFLWDILTGINAGTRTYGRDFLLSQCDQIRTGEIQVQLWATTCINVHQSHLCRRGKRVGVGL